MSPVDPFAPPSDPTDDQSGRDDGTLPTSGTWTPREFDQFSLEPTGGPDLIPGIQRDPSVASVRARRASVPGFGPQPGMPGPVLRTRPRRLSEQDAIPRSPQRPLVFERPSAPEPPPPQQGRASPPLSPPAAGPAQLSVPSAASRALLVGLDAFDDFVEDGDIPLVANGPKWPDPPKLDREGKLVAFQTELQPVKWGWAETWTSPPPQEWRTATDGILDDDFDDDSDEHLIGLVEQEEGDAPPTTQSPLGRLRGRREFSVGDDAEIDVPGGRVPVDRSVPHPPSQIVSHRSERPARERGPVRAPTPIADRDSVRRDRDSAWRDIQPDIPRQRAFGDAAAPAVHPPAHVLATPPIADRTPPARSAPPSTRAAGDAPPEARLRPGPGGALGRTPPMPTIDRPTPELPPRSRSRQPRPSDDPNNAQARRRESAADPAADEEESTAPSRRRMWLGFGALSILFAFILQTFVLQANTIPSTSMSPTLIIDDYVLVSKLSYVVGGPGRADVVVFDRPESVASQDDVFIKRVIGLPGETITFVEGKVVIDGEPLEESYTASPNSTFPLVDQIPGCGPPRPDGGCLIPEDSIFVMGDNRRNSSDSRRFGPIKKDAIEGRAFMRIWPSSRIGGL